MHGDDTGHWDNGTMYRCCIPRHEKMYNDAFEMQGRLSMVEDFSFSLAFSVHLRIHPLIRLSVHGSHHHYHALRKHLCFIGFLPPFRCLEPGRFGASPQMLILFEEIRSCQGCQAGTHTPLIIPGSLKYHLTTIYTKHYSAVLYQALLSSGL